MLLPGLIHDIYLLRFEAINLLYDLRRLLICCPLWTIYFSFDKGVDFWLSYLLHKLHQGLKMILSNL